MSAFTEWWLFIEQSGHPVDNTKYHKYLVNLKVRIQTS